MVRSLVLALVVSLFGPVAPPVAAAAADGACPPTRVPATAFRDTVTSLHRAAIDCTAWWGLASGRSRTSFGPTDAITRGQTAAMAARLLRTTGRAPAAVPSAGFRDTAGHPFEADIDLLASLGIVDGVTPTEFAPDRPIARGQMASVIARTFEGGYESPLPEGSASFEDVPPGNVHREAIGSLVAARITTGVTLTTYAPARSVTRAEMASFLARSAGLLVDRGHATPPAGGPPAGDPHASRTRGAWVHLFDDTLKTRAGIVRMLDELEAAGANTVIAQVIRRHDAYYDSDVLPRTPDPAVAPDFDVLATLLEEARPRGIAVHAWYSVAPTWHGVYENLPAPDGWVATEHGRSAPVADRWVTRKNDGGWSDYLDPGLKEVQDHVAAVVGEIAQRYDVDGIHLDYTRYQSEFHGYNPAAIVRYREETGATGWPDVHDPAWSEWRRKQTWRIVARSRQAIEASGRDIMLSAAVISWGSGPPTPDRAGFRRTLPYTRTLQDWDNWVRRGDVDAVMPMNYFRATDPNQARWFRQWLEYEARLTATEDARIVPGPGGYLNQPGAVLDQVAAAVRRANGAVIYSYQQPTVDGTRFVWQRLAGTRWFYPPLP